MTTDTDTFTLTRRIAAPAGRLWHLLTDPEQREKWGAPGEENVLTMISADLRVGGTDRHRCGPAENPDFEVDTQWFRLDAPHDAVFTELIRAGGAELGASLVTCRLVPAETGTDLHITVAASSFVGPEMIAEFRAGWDGGFDKLAALAAA